MTREELLARISIDPEICFGKPCIRGHRIWVSLILDMMASGMTMKEILDQYPGLDETDMLACIANGAEMARERYFEVPIGGGGWKSKRTGNLGGRGAQNCPGAAPDVG